MKIHLLWQNYRYFPYERELARREVHAMTGRRPSVEKTGLVAKVQRNWTQLAKRTTYFREILSDDGERIIPLQTQLEAVTNGSTVPTSSTLAALPTHTRQSTRYSGHGLHEYRGKFNPQVVRAISNILELRPGDWLFDPFCGSGTALLEALHLGLNAVGIDLNPLAVEIANAKVASMRVPSDQLLEETVRLKLCLGERIAGMHLDKTFSANQIRRVAGDDWQNRLNCPEYLHLWFTQSVLAQLAAIMQEIEKLPSKNIRSIMRVVLSNIVRDVSLQDSTDLRIRRRKSPPENAPAIPLFLDSLSKKLSCILKARQLIQTTSTTQAALLGNVLSCRELLKAENRQIGVKHFDAAITSPPYATALPYIDTQRLSLVLLGLIDARQIRDTERSLIGNREITPGERAGLETALKANRDSLPRECVSLCQELHDAVDLQSDGFRRQNVPGLLYKYLTEMAGMFREVHTVLRKGARYALIVGRNGTLLGSRHFTIDTPRLLSVLAEANGFRLSDSMEFDAYHRFDVHQANSIRTETLIILEKL
jgi:site-specific DNA-methyltransferase (cytosine-N4-specific)